MTQLSHHQWSLLNQFTLELHSANSREHFFHCCLERLPAALDLLCVAWNDFDKNFAIVNNQETAAFAEVVGGYIPKMIETMASHPVVEHVSKRIGSEAIEETLAMSDFVSQRQLRDRAIHFETYRHLGIHDQMYTELQFTHRHRSGLTLNAGKPFSDEQKEMARLVREHVLVAYRNVLRDENTASTKRLVAEKGGLSPRLQQTLQGLLEGLPRKLIADRMGLSLHTVNDYVQEIYAKLNVHSHAELIAKMSTNGGWASGPTAFKREPS